jgi:hypothetical protein
MKSDFGEVRLTGKSFFAYCIKVKGMVETEYYTGGCTNKRVLAKKTGIGYDLLMKVFTRKGLVYFENEHVIIIKVKRGDIEKGKQSFSRQGKGSMEVRGGIINL